MRLHLALALLVLASVPGEAQTIGVDSAAVLVIRAETAAGTVQLEAPVGATRTRDGRIVVAEPTSLRVFGRDGALQATVGRAGAGPGEFRRVFWVSSCGTDSVFVFDLPRGSLDVLSPDGALTPAVEVRRAVPAGAGNVMAVSCAYGGGRFAVMAGPANLAEVAPNIRRGTAQVQVADRSDWRFSAGAMVPSAEFIVLGGGGAPRPLGRNTSIGFAGTTLVIGTGDSAGVLRLPPNGVASPLRVAVEARPVTAAMRERSTRDLLDLVAAPMRTRMQQMLEGVAWPERAPAYLRVVPTSTGELWLELPATAAGTTELVGIAADGRVASRIVLPVAAHSVEVSASEVLTVSNDADGVPSVRVFRRR